MASSADSMTVVLYRPSLDARSGAGQLLEMQWRGLRAAGIDAQLACARGALRFWWRTGVRARRRSVAGVERLRESGATIVDHGACVTNAHVVFVHNLATEAAQHLPAAGVSEAVERERRFFSELQPNASIVANSRLVADALIARYALSPERIRVLYPGYRAQRFNLERAATLRSAARRALSLPRDALLVGFVTSGDFAKRGLDVFLDCAARICAHRPDARFLVVGSKRLPDWARDHAVVRAGLLQYRPKVSSPEPWFAALDLFLYAAHYEEFGIVLAEAQAMGVPVLTSRLVGASECLPAVYAPWLVARPEAEPLAAKAVTLLADVPLRRELAAAAARSVTAFDERAYVAGAIELIAAQKRRLK